MSDAATRAILVAGHAVAYATAYLDGRNDLEQLSQNADRLLNDLLAIGDADTNSPLASTRVLMVAMMRTVRAARMPAARSLDLYQARLEHWRDIMSGLVEIVRMDVGALRDLLETSDR